MARSTGEHLPEGMIRPVREPQFAAVEHRYTYPVLMRSGRSDAHNHPSSVIATIAGGPNPDDGASEGGRRGRHRIN